MSPRLRRLRQLGLIAVLSLVAFGNDAVNGAFGGVAGAGAAEKGVTIAVVGSVPLDPAAVSPVDQSQAAAEQTMWRGLTSLDRDGAATGDVAAGWTTSADWRRWTFSVDPAASFASGAPIASSDVVYTMRRLVDRRDTSLAGETLADLLEHYPTGAVAESAVTLSADGGVTFRLRRPFSEFAKLLAAPQFGVVRHGEFGAALASVRGQRVMPDLSGNYEMRDVSAGGVDLHRVAGDGPKVVRLVVKKDTDAAYRSLGAGTVDWSPVPYRFGAAPGVLRGAAASNLYVSLNLRSPKFADIRVRRLLFAALDGPTLARSAFGAEAVVAQGVVPAGISTLSNRAPCMGKCRFDPASVFDFVNSPLGKLGPIRLDVFDTPRARALAGAIVAELGMVGIRVEMRVTPLSKYAAVVSHGSTELAISGAVPMYPSPGQFLMSAFASGGSMNLAGLHSALVDSSLAAAQSAPLAARRRAYALAEAAVLDSSVSLPVAEFPPFSQFAGTWSDAWVGGDNELHWS